MTGGGSFGGMGGGLGFVIIIIRDGGDVFRQNPPFNIQIISSGDSYTQTM